jgi:hypothetical protein
LITLNPGSLNVDPPGNSEFLARGVGREGRPGPRLWLSGFLKLSADYRLCGVRTPRRFGPFSLYSGSVSSMAPFFSSEGTPEGPFKSLTLIRYPKRTRAWYDPERVPVQQDPGTWSTQHACSAERQRGKGKGRKQGDEKRCLSYYIPSPSSLPCSSVAQSGSHSPLPSSCQYPITPHLCARPPSPLSA